MSLLSLKSLSRCQLITGFVAACMMSAICHAQSETSYEITYSPRVANPTLRVNCFMKGLTAPCTIELPNFGEWTDVDSLYLREFSSTPKLHRHPGANIWSLETAPDGWNGSLEISYSIPFIDLGSNMFERHGLLPWSVRNDKCDILYSSIQTANTLARCIPSTSTASGDGQRATVTFLSDAPVQIFAGWAGPIQASTPFVLPAGPAFTDSIIVFGQPRTAHKTIGTINHEVYQFTSGEDITDEMLALSSALTTRYGQATGLPLDHPSRVLIIDKGGGQWTSGGLFVQPGSREELKSPYYCQLVAHELFHHWLGGYAKYADPALVWFMEGFTDYQSILHLVGTGHASRDWFIRRMLEIDSTAKASSSLGTVAFADPSVTWRDHNGPLETLAYKGAACLAFHIDAKLLERGKPRLAVLIGELARANGGIYTLQSIRSTMAKHGVEDLFTSYIERPFLPAVEESLRSAGFEIQPTQLSYCGIATGGSSLLGTITKLDETGPAAAAGIRIGDTITGAWPCRQNAILSNSTESRLKLFGTGTTLFDPGAETINIGLTRAGESMTVVLTPLRIDGGISVTLPPAATALDPFFSVATPLK